MKIFEKQKTQVGLCGICGTSRRLYTLHLAVGCVGRMRLAGHDWQKEMNECDLSARTDRSVMFLWPEMNIIYHCVLSY